MEISKLSLNESTWLKDVPFHPALVSRMAEIRHNLREAVGMHEMAMRNVQNGEFAEGLWAQLFGLSEIDHDDPTKIMPYVSACPYCSRYLFHKANSHPAALSKGHCLWCEQCGWAFTVPDKPSEELAEFVKAREGRLKVESNVV